MDDTQIKNQSVAQGDSAGRKLSAGVKELNQMYKEQAVQQKAKELDMSYVNLTLTPINPDLARTFPKEEAEAAGAALYFQTGKKLKLAMTDLYQAKAQTLIDRLRKEGYWVEISLCSEESLMAAHKIYFSDEYKKQEEIKNVVKVQDLGSFAKEIGELTGLKDKVEAAPFDQALNLIQLGAFKSRSSDIHFLPGEKSVDVRLRADGVLRPVFNLTPKAYDGISKEIKYLAHLKMNVTNVPQDGQYSFVMNQRQINVRVSTLPTHFGEAIVMRLLDPGESHSSFEQLGFEGAALKNMQDAVKLPHGMILVTGPTGSGKTSTLYTMLHSIDTETRKIVTLEDPIEYNLPGISQSQIDESRDFTFAMGLRATLRQDPDVIMVGEIRDAETAETAAQASLTGHLVFSTLHTNSAAESIPRLINMGVKSFILAPALNLIVAQRLVRKLCPRCSFGRALNAGEKEMIRQVLDGLQRRGIPAPLMPVELRSAQGCDFCGQTGFKGQLAIAEALAFDPTLRDLVLEGKPMSGIRDHIENSLKMISLHDDGILKVIRGVTTPEEVCRVSQ